MPHFQGQHDAPPPATQFVTITTEQFSQLIELLTPGYNLAKLYLEQARAAAHRAPDPIDPIEPTE